MDKSRFDIVDWCLEAHTNFVLEVSVHRVTVANTLGPLTCFWPTCMFILSAFLIYKSGVTSYNLRTLSFDASLSGRIFDRFMVDSSITNVSYLFKCCCDIRLLTKHFVLNFLHMPFTRAAYVIWPVFFFFTLYIGLVYRLSFYSAIYRDVSLSNHLCRWTYLDTSISIASLIIRFL